MLRLVLLLAMCAAPLHASCTARDFLTVPLPSEGDPIATALEIGYPGIKVQGGTLAMPDGTTIPFVAPRDVSPQNRLDGATIGDMFVYTYPLAFDLAPRLQPYVDPGRLRNEAFFRALYADSESAVRATLVSVAYSGQSIQTSFNVTTQNCVDSQLAAVLAALAQTSPAYDVFFEQSGGSFNWRVIAGTDRMSSHSFGAAIDLNTELGGYWRWSGRPEGDAGPFDNKIPADLVATFERFGFVWGGKWHHFDGMHFEYRPELILYARLMADQ